MRIDVVDKIIELNFYCFGVAVISVKITELDLFRYKTPKKFYNGYCD